jgi:hypothetical protein
MGNRCSVERFAPAQSLSAYWKSRAAVRRCCVDEIDPWCGARFGLT